MQTDPSPEHRWLQQLVGAWECELKCEEPGGKTNVVKGREVVRALGDLWVVGEMTMPIPGTETPMTSLITLGYDPGKGRFVGSWVGTPMAQLITYEGSLDEGRRILTLDCEGPAFDDPTKPATYQDIIELKGEKERLFHTQVLGEDGEWNRIVESVYRRVG